MYLAETVASGLVWKQFDSGVEAQPVSEGDAAGFPDEWRKFVYTAENTASSESADDQQFTFDVVNITNGQVDSSWNETDYQTVEAQLSALAGAFATGIASYLHITKVEAYARAFNPYSLPKPFADSGAPQWSKVLALSGGASSQAAPQCCTTLTEITPSRRHWGRTYLPTIGQSAISTSGRLATTFQNSMISAAETAYAALQGAEFFPVVPTTWSGKTKTEPGSPTRTLQLVTGLRVDDVLDVHRSRRYRHSTLTVTKPATAGTHPAAAESAA